MSYTSKEATTGNSSERFLFFLKRSRGGRGWWLELANRQLKLQIYAYGSTKKLTGINHKNHLLIYIRCDMINIIPGHIAFVMLPEV